MASLFPYVSPGDAAASTFASLVRQDEADKRQAFLDDLNRRKVENEIAMGQAALKEKRDEAAARLDEIDQKKTERDVASLAKGDIPSFDLLARAKKHGMDLRLEQAPPTAPESMPGVAAVPMGQVQQGITPTRTGLVTNPAAGPGGVRFAGSPAQAEEARKRDANEAIKKQLEGLDPSDPAFKRLAFEYEITNNKQLPAAYFTNKQGSSDTAPVMRQNPRSGTVERLVDGAWTTWSGDVPKGAHWMTEPPPKDTSARDLQRGNQLQTAREHAYTELDKRATPVENQLAAKELGTALNQRTPGADAIIAPLVLKATISSTGTGGFRMNEPEINRVVGAGSHWDSLKRALLKWDTDHSQALSLTDDQREDLRKLAREIRKGATQVSRQITDARHKIDDADDLAGVNHARTTLQETLDKMESEDEGDGGASGGLPQVGGTFMGGKVLSITPKAR
jgi:hypothetical protein